jgi:hypothetical protein
MHDVSSAWTVLRQAKALGVKLALDDFGTGYSSLSYVRRFSLDMLKIDKSFIDGIDSSPEDRAIVEHVVGMAQALGMVTVAEGVERPEQLQWLRRLGCRLAQGYVLSRPIPGQDFEAILERHEIDPFGITGTDAKVAARPAPPAPPSFDAPVREVLEVSPVAGSAAPAPRPSVSAPAPEPAVGPLMFAAPGTAPASLDDALGFTDGEPLDLPLVGATMATDAAQGPGSTDPTAPPSLPRLREYRPADED